MRISEKVPSLVPTERGVLGGCFSKKVEKIFWTIKKAAYSQMRIGGFTSPVYVSCLYVLYLHMLLLVFADFHDDIIHGVGIAVLGDQTVLEFDKGFENLGLFLRSHI